MFDGTYSVVIPIIEALSQHGLWCCEIPDFDHFCLTAKPNTRFTYFVGPSIQMSILARTLQKRTYRCAVQGEIYLVQKRFDIDRHVFEYMAIKASRAPVVSLLPYSEEKLAQVRRLEYVKPANEKH